jgi:hypothetical protein
VLPGVVLTDFDEKAQCWSATTPDRGEIWLQLKESAEETSGQSVWTLELNLSPDATATAVADAAELEKLVRLSAAFARHGAATDRFVGMAPPCRACWERRRSAPSP